MSNTGYDSLHIIAAGSAVIKNIPATVRAIVHSSGTAIGTVNFYDAITAGTTGTNRLTVGTSNIANAYPVDMAFSKGIVYNAVGTPDISVTFE